MEVIEVRLRWTPNPGSLFTHTYKHIHIHTRVHSSHENTYQIRGSTRLGLGPEREDIVGRTNKIRGVDKRELQKGKGGTKQ